MIDKQHTVHMKKHFLNILLISLTLLVSSVSYAQSDPQQTLQTSIDSLISDFTAHREELATDKTKLYAFAERSIDDNWDFNKMAQLVLGKNWRKINDDQKSRFTTAFKGLLIRTYSSTMFKYTGKEAITLKTPIYKGKDNKRAVVNATGSLGNGTEPVPLAFSMFLDKDGSWRIYNVAAAGVSLVTTFRSSYNQIISSKGIDSLIDSINRKAG